MRRLANETFGMSQIGVLEDLSALSNGGGGEAIVNHGGGEQTEPGMTMIFVVPAEKILAKGASILD